MSNSQSPIELDSLKPSHRQRKTSRFAGPLIAIVLGMVSAFVGFFLLKDHFLDADSASVPVQQEIAQTDHLASDSNSEFSGDSEFLKSTEGKSSSVVNVEHHKLSQDDENPSRQAQNESKYEVQRETTSEDQTGLTQPLVEIVEENQEPTLPEYSVSTTPLRAERDTTGAPEGFTDESNEIAEAASSEDQLDRKEDDEEKHDEIKLSKRRWTTLVLFKGNEQEEFPIPKDFPLWNYKKDYSFSGGSGGHILGQFRIDGEFIIRNGYLQREFGNSALLHLPQAENFDLEGVIQLDGPSGWLMLLGWDIDSKIGLRCL